MKSPQDEVIPAKDSAALPTEHKKHSLVSRIGLALAFSTIGAKIGTLGMIADASAAFQGESMTLGEKFRGVFNGNLAEKLQERIMSTNPESMSAVLKASSKVFKFTFITTAVGMVGGGVLGWVRGSRVEHAKDIFIHPIKSLKLVLGPKPEEHPKTETTRPERSHVTADPAEETTRWRDSASQPQQQAYAGL
jgi:hypothetical protein